MRYLGQEKEIGLYDEKMIWYERLVEFFKRWSVVAREMGLVRIVSDVAYGPHFCRCMHCGRLVRICPFVGRNFQCSFWARVQYPAARMGISEERGIIATLSTKPPAFLTGTYFMFDKMKWEVKGCREIAVVRFILFKDGLV